MRRVILASVLCLSASNVAEASTCKPGDVAGLYKGVARGSDGSGAEVTLNLLCADGEYVVQLFTSQGDFKVTDASGSSGHVKFNFDTGASLAAADLTVAGDKLSGAYLVAGDHGLLTLTRVGPALARDAMVARLNLTLAQWREDIEYFARELPRRHANAFFSLSRAAFEAQVAALKGAVGRLHSDEIFVGLQRIASAVGDGHTGLVTPLDRRPLPIEIGKFGDDFRITAAGPGLEGALGGRIVRIGDTPIVEAWARALTITPQSELMELREGRALIYLTRGITLHGLGIVPVRNHAIFMLASDTGRLFPVRLNGAGVGEKLTLHSIATGPAPLWKQNPERPFWCREVSERRALYCAFHSYQGLEEHAGQMFAMIEKAHPAKLIIDMRDNGGGDNTEGYKWLIKPLKARSDVNVKGRLFVLIGPLTFSAAMNNAAQFADETKAMLVGQAIGEKPNSYQEPRQFRLPNSHLIVRASTLFYSFRKTGENAVRPHKEIVPSWRNFVAGRDPVLDWVLAQPVP